MVVSHDLRLVAACTNSLIVCEGVPAVVCEYKEGIEAYRDCIRRRQLDQTSSLRPHKLVA